MKLHFLGTNGWYDTKLGSRRRCNNRGFMNIADAIAILDKEVVNPQAGLPDEVFFYISKITPLVNVDLLS